MEKEILRKVQLIQLKIAKEIKRVCEENNINYFLDSGSLLGAVRHNGFIPWDDDLDIGMLRNDYEKFLNVATKTLKEDYFLQTWDTDKNYPLAFAKIRKKGTIYVEQVAEMSKAENGIYVDIFPYDVFPNKKIQKIRQGVFIEIYRRIMLIKLKYYPWTAKTTFLNKVKTFIAYLPIFIISIFVNKEKIKQKYVHVMTMYNNRKTGFLYEQPSASRYGKYIFPDTIFASFINLKFEDAEFSCPVNNKKWLQIVYGDYMKLPPIEKRENRHRIIKIKL